MTDFLIIGGGIAGLSAGARLSHLGRVTLLEMESALGYHSSGRSAALFEETYGAPSVVALNRASKSYLQSANGGVLSPRGMLLVGSPAQAQVFADDVQRMEMTPIPMDQAVQLFPILNRDVVDRAAFHPDAWDIDTDLLLQNFAREIRANGGQIVTRGQVTGIRRTPSGWEVSTAKDSYQGHILVNAAGAWADRVATMAGIAPIGFTPLRRSMARIAAPAGYDVSGWPMVFGPGKTVTHFFNPCAV